MLRNYLRERSLFYEMLECQMSAEITLKVAPGPILGLYLWNAYFGSLLRLDMPEEAAWSVMQMLLRNLLDILGYGRKEDLVYPCDG